MLAWVRGGKMTFWVCVPRVPVSFQIPPAFLKSPYVLFRNTTNKYKLRMVFNHHDFSAFPSIASTFSTVSTFSTFSDTVNTGNMIPSE